MASNISNAVGTQRQFTKQPVSTYQKQLQGFQSSASHILDNSAGYRLAEALNGLGSMIRQYGLDREERLKLYARRADDIVNAATAKDWETLQTIDLMNQYSTGYNLTDNPYAVAKIEEGRGKYYAAKVNSEYQDYVNANGKEDDPYKETERYQNFVHDKYREAQQGTSNLVAFNMGYYANFPQDSLNILDTRRAEKSTELKQIRDGTTQADLNEVIRAHNPQTPDVTLANIQRVLNGATLTNMTRPERTALVTKVLEDSALWNASPDLLDYLANNLIVYTEDDGSPVFAKDIIPMNQLKIAAENSAKNQQDEWYVNTLIDWNKCQTVGELTEKFNSLPLEQQHMMQPDFGKFKQSLANYELKMQQQRIQQGLDAQQANINAGKLRIAEKAGADGEIPPDLSGIPKEQKIKFGFDRLQEIAQQQGDKASKAKAVLNLLDMKGMKDFADQYKEVIENAFERVTERDAMGDPSMMGVQAAMDMFYTNPNLTISLLGDKTGKNLVVLNALLQTTSDATLSYRMFAQGRLAMRDSKQKEVYEARANALLDDTDFMVRDTDSVNKSYGKDANAWLNSTAYHYLTYALASGMSDDAALSQYEKFINDNYVDIEGQAIPQGFFGTGIDFKDGKALLDDMRDAETVLNDEENPDNFSWVYDMNTCRLNLVCQTHGLTHALPSYTAEEFQRMYWDANRARQQEEALSPSTFVPDKPKKIKAGRNLAYVDELRKEGVVK